jgi:peptide/nickel transport system permease protein
MIRYIIKRLIMMIPIMIGVTLFLFLLLSLTPGDPAKIALGSTATEEQLELFREQNGLNDPLIVQYVNYMLKAVTGDLGTSFLTRQSVNSMIATRAPTTLFLSFASMAVTIIVALFLGIAMAVKQNSFFDNFMRVLTVIFTSMPQFWLGLMMIILFTVNLKWLPSSGLFATPGDWIMPIICLAMGGITMCARTGRSSMLEVINQDYIRTARAKGLKYNYIIRRHALKNALLPMVSVYGRIIATCFSGSVVLEQVFGINGIGQMMTNALRQKDVPAIMGSIIISAFVITIVNLLTDLTYAFIDPRIKSKYARNKSKQKAVSANADR